MTEKIKPGKRLYLNAEMTRIVEEGDPDAAFLWCNEYQTVDEDEYKRLKGTRQNKQRKTRVKNKGVK